MSDEKRAPRLLRRKQVEHQTGLSRSYIYSKMRAGKFPLPISPNGGRCVFWIQSEINRWIDEQINQSRAGNGTTSHSKPKIGVCT